MLPSCVQSEVKKTFSYSRFNALFELYLDDMFISQDQITKYIQYYTKSFCGIKFKLFREDYVFSIASLYCPDPGLNIIKKSLA